MMRSIRAELLRLSRWPAVWVLAGTWLTLTLTFGYLFNYLTYRSEDPSSATGPGTGGVPASVLLEQMSPANVPLVGVQGLPMFGGALVLTLGALAVGSGYNWGTWKTVFTLGPRRGGVLAGTVGALGVILSGLVLVSFALATVAAVVITTTEGQALTWPSLLELGQGLGAGLLIAAMWASAGVLLGTLARGPALAVGLGLVWALVVENLLRGVAGLLGPVEAVTNVLPGTAAGSLVGALGAAPQGDPAGTPGVLTVLAGAPATGLLVAYLVLFLGITAAMTVQRDIV